MGYKRELKQPKVYDGKPSFFNDREGIRGDIPKELKENLDSMGIILDAFNVPFLKKIVFSAMYHAYNINRV